MMLVDDQELVRRGLRLLLETVDDVEVVAEARSGAEALQVLHSAPMDLALVDARMPGMSGMELVARLRDEVPELATLVLTTFDDDDVVLGSLRAGARGFLLKDASLEDLVRGMKAALRGETVIDPRVAGRVVELTVGAGAPEIVEPAAPEGLTEREAEVAALVREGRTNREIAQRLFLAEGTVKNHVSAVLQKLQLRDRTALALFLRERQHAALPSRRDPGDR